MSASQYVYLEDCRVLRETDAAFLVDYDGDELWLPRSQVADADDLTVSNEPRTIGITEWIAKQKGIET